MALSYAEERVADLKEALETLSTIKSYSVGSGVTRQITKTDREDLIKELKYWESQVKKDEDAEKVRLDLGNPNIILSRF